MGEIIKGLEKFNGQHCETTMLGNLLYNIDIKLSEPILFGIGEGLGYIFFNMKLMDFPFIGGRIKQDLITQKVSKNLNLKLTVNETSSVKKAWYTVRENIDNGIPTGLKLDSYYLDYFSNKIHFAGHYVTIYGYDDTYAYLIDTIQQGETVKATLENLQLARNAKGPMSSKNMSLTISKQGEVPPLKDILLPAIKRNAEEYLNPPIQNIGYKGIAKTTKEIFKWFESSKDIQGEFTTQAMLMERAGTGGALFRNIYRDFLKESFELLKLDKLEQGYVNFIEIADLWTRVSSAFEKVGQTQKVDYLHEAAEILKIICEKEKNTMGILYSI